VGVSEILAQIDQEIAQLQHARALLVARQPLRRRKQRRPPPRNLQEEAEPFPEGRKRIAEAVKPGVLGQSRGRRHRQTDLKHLNKMAGSRPGHLFFTRYRSRVLRLDRISPGDSTHPHALVHQCRQLLGRSSEWGKCCRSGRSTVCGSRKRTANCRFFRPHGVIPSNWKHSPRRLV